MPDVHACLEYLQKLPLYEDEKPYYCFLPPHEGFDPDAQRLDNLEFENHDDILIRDMRDRIEEYKIDDCGFEVVEHESRFSKFERENDVEGYRTETEQLLMKTMGAVSVTCYDSGLRKNVQFQRRQLDLNDRLLIASPARGVHNGMLILTRASETVYNSHLPGLLFYRHHLRLGTSSYQ
jgi:hypothetical protein